METDSLFFINVDEREGYSHRIQVDADGDGEYNGSDDFSSAWLQGSCDLDENGSKVEPDCMVTWLVFLGRPEQLFGKVLQAKSSPRRWRVAMFPLYNL